MPCTAQVHRLRDSDPELIVLCAEQMMLGLCTELSSFSLRLHVSSWLLYVDASLCMHDVLRIPQRPSCGWTCNPQLGAIQGLCANAHVAARNCGVAHALFLNVIKLAEKRNQPPLLV